MFIGLYFQSKNCPITDSSHIELFYGRIVTIQIRHFHSTCPVILFNYACILTNGRSFILLDAKISNNLQAEPVG